MIKKIEAKIKEKLESLWDFIEVFEYYKADFKGFPYASFELVDCKWEKLDTCTNIRKYSFWILIFQETEVASREKAKDILYNIFDKIILAFDSDETLGGLVENSEVVEIVMNDGIDDNKWKWLYGAITINFSKLIQIR